MTRDFLAYGELFNDGIPFPGWSFRVSGLEKWPIIKWAAKSASIDHSYAGKESRSWQYEDISPVDIDFFKLANFVGVCRGGVGTRSRDRSPRLPGDAQP